MPSQQRRRLDVEERRRAILDAARDAYGETPYASVSVAQVAQAADASPALVFHYFGSKAGLYAAVVAQAVDSLTAAQQAALDALAEGTPIQYRIRTALAVYLDYIGEHPQTWATPLRDGEEPSQAREVRRDARATAVQRLTDALGVRDWARHRYAVWGFFGFLDEACLHWTEHGCPDDERHPLMDAALGALEGALGDWRT